MRKFLKSAIQRTGLVAVLAGVLIAGSLTVTSGGSVQAADPTSRVITLINAERGRAGLVPLTYNPNLTHAAQSYAQVLATSGCWGHTCGPLPYVVQRLEASGYTQWTRVGENLAGGQSSPEAVVAAWLASPGHRANIMNPYFTEIGVGVAYGGPYRVYWAQEFGARSRYYLTPWRNN